MKRCAANVLESGRAWLLFIGMAVTMIAGTVEAAAVRQINCGTSTAVSPFTADQYGSGGTQHTVTNTITVTGITNPAPAAVYQSERYGTCTYTIPSLTANTQYQVRLHFCELYQTAANARRFNVSINGTSVLSNFDIYASAGARYKAVLREFTATSNASGQIVITFTTVTDNATISGIEIHTIGTPPTVATAAAVSPSPVNGTTTSLSVLGADDGGESNLTYTWATTGTPPAAVTFSGNANNGTNGAKSQAATFTRAGSYTLQVTIRDVGNLTVTSSVTFTVNQALSSITVSPSSANVSATSTQQFTASGLDQFGTALSTQPTFTWSVNGGGTINAGGLFTAGNTPGGSYIVTATNASINGTSPVTVTANTTPTVSTVAASSPNPVTGTTANLSVLGADNGGESNLTYNWATTGTPPAAVAFSVNGTNAAKACAATFTHAGAYSIRATITDALGLSVTSDVNVTVNQTLTTVTVSPANTGVNLNATQQFTATGSDQFGIVMGTQPTFTWTVNGGGTINSGSGLFTAGSTAGGPYTVTATGGGRNGTAQVTVTSDPAPTIATAPAANPDPVTATTVALSVLGADNGGEANLIYTWSTTGTPPAAVTFSVTGSSNGTNEAKNCTATFTQAGNYIIRVTVRDVPGGQVSSDRPLMVVQSLTTVTVSPSSSSVSAGGSTQQFTASGLDQFGTALSIQPTFFWTVSGGGSISSSNGLFTPGSSAGGPYTVTATEVSGWPSGTAQVTVTSNTAPAVATAASASPNPVTGTTASLNVLGSDNGGESNLTYAWATTGTPPAAVAFSVNGTNAAKACAATFTHAGAYVIRATITDALGLSVTSDVNVTVNQTLTTVTVSPANTGVNLNATQQFTATGSDQFGTTMGTQPTFIWTVNGGGTINSGSGLFTAGSIAGGPYTVTATGGGRNGTAQVTVTSDPAPTIANAPEANPNPVAGTTVALSVLGADNGGEANLIYTWSTTGTPPAAVTFSPNGTNAAKNSVATFTRAGPYPIRVTISDVPGGQVTADVPLMVNQTMTSVSVTPSTATVNVNQTQQFTVSALDQFGTALTTQPSFVWMVSGGGTVNPTGSFTASSNPGGPYTVTATVATGGMTGTASFSVQLVPLVYVYPNVCGANQNMKVDGQIKCNSLLIHNWLLAQKGAPQTPDYVFDRDYKLPSLADVEQFIKANGHLPEVPAAKELESKGVDMIQLNFILLKKIEEMTLHMIRQQKEIEELKKK